MQLKLFFFFLCYRDYTLSTYNITHTIFILSNNGKKPQIEKFNTLYQLHKTTAVCLNFPNKKE